MKTIGFIILRHVSSEITAKYWKLSYECIRKYYPENEIMIIDDNSNYEFIKEEDEKNLYKVTIIKSEYPGRGELLPYIYYLRNKLFDSACIIHDSVFFNKYIDLTVDNYKFLWDFDSKIIESKLIVKNLINNLSNSKDLRKILIRPYLWNGCFGCMMIIDYNFLSYINNKCNLEKLINIVTCRKDRMCFERVIAIIATLYAGKKESLLGHISNYCKWGSKFQNIKDLNHLPVIKVWTGR